MAKDYYAILGIDKTASDKDVRAAFRRLARKHHPDVNPGDTTAEAKFKEINAAYEVLSDPDKRKKYDQYGENWEHADRFAEASASRPGRQRVWTYRSSGGSPFGRDPFEDIFESVMNDRPSARSRARSRGEDLLQPVEVSLEDAYKGTTVLLTFNRQEPCASCGGSGLSSRHRSCPVCQGTGARAQPKRLEVKIPPGVKDGSRIRIAGEGSPGITGDRGDLYLDMSVTKHDRFRREGDDLHVDVPVAMTDALLGGEVPVETIDGSRLMLKIPPETQNGKLFRLSGKGMPHLGADQKGDLYAHLKVVLPEKLSTKERELVEQLRSLRKAGER